ncbi:MAG: TRAP transporter substrate-binding protein [Pseudomonadota bacterium]|nr:TRAP transporter substrate-binding protein [Pseudomonadota bacterium]
MKVKRRKVLINSLALISSSFIIGACEGGTPKDPAKSTAFIKKKIRWKMATAFPKNFPGSDLNAQKIKKKIEAASNGNFEIEHYGAGELVPAFEIFDAIRNGTIDCGVSAPYYWISKHKAIPFFCTVPGGMTAIEKFAWITYGGGQELWDKLYSQYGVKSLLSGNTGVQMGGWFRSEIKSVNDFKGIKMRIPGIGAEIVNLLGGTAVNMPAGEIMPALQQGVIDAAEWVGPWVDKISGFHKIAKYYYGPGIHEPGTANELILDLSKWLSLPQNFKEIVINACHSVYIESLGEYMYQNSISLNELEKKFNVIIRHYPKEITKKMLTISRDVVRSFSNLGKVHNEIYSSWEENLKKFNRYQEFGDYGYVKNRLQVSSYE